MQEVTQLLQRMKADIRKDVIEDLIRYLRAQLAAGEQTAGGPTLEGKGITEGSEIVLKEVGPRSTREIGQILLARGVKTSSKNFTATVYTCLQQAPDKFRRRDDGMWELSEKKKK